MVKLHYLVSENDVNRKGTINFDSKAQALLQVISMFLDFMEADEFIVTCSPDGSSIDVKVNMFLPKLDYKPLTDLCK